MIGVFQASLFSHFGLYIPTHLLLSGVMQMPLFDASVSAPADTDQTSTVTLLEHYHLTCNLALYWLRSMRTRLPVAGAVLGLGLLWSSTLGQEMTLAMLALVPLATRWLVHSTIEDIRALDETTDTIANMRHELQGIITNWTLLVPRPTLIERSAESCLTSTMVISGLLLAGCLHVGHDITSMSEFWRAGYVGFLTVIVIELVIAYTGYLATRMMGNQR